MLTETKLNPNWYLIWGNLNFKPKESTFYQPGKIAIVGTKPAFSPNQNFMVVGDISLTNYREFSSISPTTDLELIAYLWEKEGINCLNLLQGIFALVVWQKDVNNLWLIRDHSGGKTIYYYHNNSQSNSIYYIAPRLKTLSSKQKSKDK